MLCSISGEVPQEPVASKKSGAVFERRLVETYISENGTDPISGEHLTTDDLIPLKTARVVRPRPPTLTSVPALLSAFQNEWDALALQSYSLKVELLQTRQELSTALYQHDAAVRVIARLIKERDEARDAITKLSRNGNVSVPSELPAPFSEAVAAKHQELQSTRRKRPVPAGWAAPETIQSLKLADDQPEVVCPGGRRLAIDPTGDKILIGGQHGVVGVYSISTKQYHQFSGADGAVTDGLWWDSKLLVSFDSGEVKLFDVQGTQETVLGSHNRGAFSLALHACGDIAASVGADGAYNVYDLKSKKLIARKDTEAKSALTSVAFHPDGHLIAVASSDHAIPIFDFASGSPAAQFDTEGPVDRLDFSENGVWLAVVTRGQTGVSIWDLRKAAVLKTIETRSPVLCIRFDYTGQYLAIGGPSGLAVHFYQKSAKKWTQLVETATAASDAVWGPECSSLAVRTLEGGLSLLA